MADPVVPAVERAEPQRLRLLSCNILAGARVGSYRHYVTRVARQVLPHPDKQANLDSLVDTIAAFDVVGLQEADAGSLRSGFLNQTRYLAEAAGMPYWSFQPNRRVARMAASSNGLISRFEPSTVLDYPLPGRIPGRGALLARYGNGPAALAVLVAHLSLGAQSRARQLGFIAELLSDYPNAVMMGDLNSEAGNPEFERLFQRTRLLLPAATAPTFPSWQPRRAIDHILVTEGITIERSWALPMVFSDHLPVAAHLRLPAGIAIGAMP
ncbi:MAG TPA: endonuclease/exonuclease/phosphatase family protein [Rhodanobacteraceae bacterium]|nr:endonuclease/exonuclease/phosphatase family protein [Rhodanobacteraceae bacterium]